MTIRARGEWLYTPGEYHGPEGHARFPAPSLYPLSNPGGYERTHAVPGGVLIGRIGEDGPPFLVGRGTTVRAEKQGALYLRVNDDELTDNEGWVEVQVNRGAGGNGRHELCGRPTVEPIRVFVAAIASYSSRQTIIPFSAYAGWHYPRVVSSQRQ